MRGASQRFVCWMVSSKKQKKSPQSSSSLPLYIECPFLTVAL